MNIPFGNLMNFMNQYQRFMNSRNQFGIGNNPNQIIQNMMNSGAINQQQYNMAKRLADQLKHMS